MRVLKKNIFLILFVSFPSYLNVLALKLMLNINWKKKKNIKLQLNINDSFNTAPITLNNMNL